MRQSDKCENLNNDDYSTSTWDMVGALELASSTSCKTPATFIDSI